MSDHWDILGIGIVAVDDLIYIDHFPQPDEKIAVEMMQRQGGGLTATALVTAARQGAKTIYSGRLGDDELSIFTYNDFKREGVNTSVIQHTPGSRPFHSIIIVDKSCGSRTILFDRKGVEEPDQTLLTEEVIVNSQVLFIDHFAYQIGLYASEIAHSHGIPVVADIETIEVPDLHKFLDQVDHLIVNVEFANAITGGKNVEKMVQALSNPQRAVCVVTAGDRGCWYAEHGGEVFHFPAFQVKVADSTGCGDVFHGAYAAALARGETIHRAIQVATASAAIKATRFGGREGIPDLVTVERFLQGNRGK